MDIVGTPPQNEASNRPCLSSPSSQTLHVSKINDILNDGNMSPSKSSGNDATVNPEASFAVTPEEHKTDLGLIQMPIVDLGRMYRRYTLYEWVKFTEKYRYRVMAVDHSGTGRMDRDTAIAHGARRE